MIEPSSQQLLTYISRWDLRLRFTQLAIWLPRGLSAGLIIGLAVALISRLRPWLMGREVLTVAIVATAASAVLTLLAVLIWPRPAMHKARYFDQLFGLKERNSTALELTQGAIKAPEQITQLQIRDAVTKAAAINARNYLPFRWQRNELITIVVMVVLLILAIVLANPQNALLAQQQAFKSALTQQVQQLQQSQKNIQNNQALSDADKAALNKILNDAINQLKEPNITQPEAVAALTQAEQQLNNVQTQLSPEQQSSASQAGQALNQTQATQGVGQSLGKGDLNSAAGQLQNLAQKVGAGQLTQDQMNESANALNKAADAMQSSNSAAADALKQAAKAMQQGDNAGAQNSLNQAAKALQAEQQQNNQSPQSQASQGAAQQANQGRQALSQLGNGNQNQSASSGSQSQQQAGQGSNGNSQSGQSAQGQPGVQSNNPNKNSGQQGQQGTGDQSGQSAQAGQQGGQGQQANAAGQNGQSGQNGQNGQQQSQGSDGNQSGNSGQGTGQNGQSASGASAQQSSQSGAGAGAGQGAGGAGNDVTQGQQSSSSGPFNTNNGHSDGQPTQPENVYAPSFAGGTGGQKLQLNGDTSRNNGQDPVQNGDFANNPAGQSTVPLSSVAGQAAAQADRAMDSDHVPGALRGVVKDYFSGLLTNENAPTGP